MHVCVCAHDNLLNIGPRYLKLKHIVVYGNSSEEFVISLSNPGQGHDKMLEDFSIYHNTNCQVLYFSFGTCRIYFSTNSFFSIHKHFFLQIIVLPKAFSEMYVKF